MCTFEKEIRPGVKIHCYSSPLDQEVVAYANKRPSIPGITSTSDPNDIVEIIMNPNKSIIGFIGFEDYQTCKRFSDKHHALFDDKGISQEFEAPFTIVFNQTGSGYLVIQDQSKMSLIAPHADEFDAYLSFMSSHWEE